MRLNDNKIQRVPETIDRSPALKVCLPPTSVTVACARERDSRLLSTRSVTVSYAGCCHVFGYLLFSTR